MKIAFLSAATSIHTRRWVDALALRGHEVTLFTQHADDLAELADGVRIVRLPWTGNGGYFANAIPLRRALARLRPDVLNAHYASGYGTTATLAGFAPTLLSVWGSDVYDFPAEAVWKLWLVRRNLRRATAIASTSEVMGDRVRNLIGSHVRLFVTPFGVDCERFRPEPARDHRYVTIGTVKTLAPKYGIDILLRAFARVLAKRPSLGEKRLRLLIVGSGPQESELIRLAAQLGLGAAVEFCGAVAHADVPGWLNRFDIFVAASRLDSESFGVAAVEAGACAVPSVVSRAGGLPEVVRDGETGLVVPKEDVASLADAIDGMVLDPAMRERMGRRARDLVLKTYEWAKSVEVMESAYDETVRAWRSTGR
jgi:glycosyltransferase involved in cell wall biosynthesis